jgi:hypothetical protein
VEELRKARVGDMLVHTTSMFASLAYGKLAPETRDLDDARLAIDVLRALVPLLPDDQKGGIQQVVSNLQLAYADAAAEAPADRPAE